MVLTTAKITASHTQVQLKQLLRKTAVQDKVRIVVLHNLQKLSVQFENEIFENKKWNG